MNITDEVFRLMEEGKSPKAIRKKLCFTGNEMKKHELRIKRSKEKVRTENGIINMAYKDSVLSSNMAAKRMEEFHSSGNNYK
jgi:hypothetical protein